MTILATVDYGKLQVCQAWELLEGDPNPYLVVNDLKDGSRILLRLDKRHIKPIGALEGADRTYMVPLKISDCIKVPN